MPERKRRAKPEDVIAATPRMKQLYEEGWSTVEIGEHFYFSRETVRQALASVGVEVVTRGKGRLRRKRDPMTNKQRQPLSDEEVARLRRMVGLI